MQCLWFENPSIGAASVFVHFFKTSRERAGAVMEGIVHQRVAAKAKARVEACI